MLEIILTTLNARYIHSAFGLRYLKANLAELESASEIIEFTIHERPIDIAEKLLSTGATIIGFGVYIWNVEAVTGTIAIIKQVSPETIIVIGGPEVSYEQQTQKICQLSDYVISGSADIAFRDLCQQLSAGTPPTEKYISAPPPRPDELRFPYYLYDTNDIAQRVIYVEASRGCPFKCEFCLSALDKTAWPFDTDAFLAEMDRLYQRGARHFKFVDRTFNLKIDVSIRILEFFLERLDDALFLHFELIPDHLPERLKQVIARFPAHSLQFEIGIQSFNPLTQQLISRRQDDEKTEDNLRWLRQESEAHLHTDLIIGLPAEDMTSFAAGLNRLVKLNPHEIQVGILKRLRGSPLVRHTDEFKLRFNPDPPYNILSNRDLDFMTVQRLNRFARYWDMLINSGRFNTSKAVIFGDDPFRHFMSLSDWLFAKTGQTHKIALPRLFSLLYDYLCEQDEIDNSLVFASLLGDFQRSGLKGQPPFENPRFGQAFASAGGIANRRQQRH